MVSAQAHHDPAAMTRRILFCTIGQTPQVVTETVWALQHQRQPPWVPDEVHVVTTTFALGRIREALQHPKGRLAALFGGRPPPVTIHVPCRSGSPEVYRPLRAVGDWDEEVSSSGVPPSDDALADVNSEQDAAIMGDVILQLMAGFVRDDDTEVHLSLAGGRKTMSAHALLALTLVGRRRDEASHVLVSPVDFEDHRDFWHPYQGGSIAPKCKPSPAAGGAVAPPLDPRDATVRLVPTPTPLMRYEVKKVETLEKLRLVDIVNQVNIGATLEASPHVRLLTAANVVAAGGVEAQLSAKLFALYRLIATSRRESWLGVGPDGTGPGQEGWLSIPHICFGRTRNGRRIDEVFLEFLTDAVSASPIDNDTQDNKSIAAWKAILAVSGPGKKREMAEKPLEPNLSNLRRALRKRFGASATNILFPPNREEGTLARIPGAPLGSEEASRFGLAMPPGAIEVL
jgi:hypothetical protein